MTKPPAKSGQIVTIDEQREMGLRLNRYSGQQNIVRAEPHHDPLSRHEIVDPYAVSAALPVQYHVVHEITPGARADAMVKKTAVLGLFLAVLTVAGLVMLDAWGFFLWLGLAAIEFAAVFCFLAWLDWRETPSALSHRMADGYLGLMREEQRARLWKLYGWTGDPK